MGSLPVSPLGDPSRNKNNTMKTYLVPMDEATLKGLGRLVRETHARAIEQLRACETYALALNQAQAAGAPKKLEPAKTRVAKPRPAKQPVNPPKQ